jgi:photosystem II stability/assembly factor-like uncharacterized protein
MVHLSSGEPLSIQVIRMVSLSTGWAIGRAGDGLDRILRTTDGGATWADVTPPEAQPDPEWPRRAEATSPMARKPGSFSAAGSVIWDLA